MSRTFSAAELQDLSLNLREQIAGLAQRRGGLRRVLEIPRGKPPRSDDGYFERLTWTVFKSGLTRAVVDRKWPNFRRAFVRFSVPAVAAFGSRDVKRLLRDAGIIRYREKIRATIHNAREMQSIRQEHGSFRRFLRSHDEGNPGGLYTELRTRFRHLGPYGVRTFLRRVGEDVFFVNPPTVRVLYRLGLIASPRASDEETGRAHAALAAATGDRIDVVNRLITRHGSGYELDETICDEIPRCHRCLLTHWCWYYSEIRRGGIEPLGAWC